MKDRPIIMQAESVRGIMDGRKTQTRRLVNADISSCFDLERDGSLQIMTIEDKYGEQVPILDLCPYGMPGDRLWVRETFRFDGYYDNRPPSMVPKFVTVECEVLPDAIATPHAGHRRLAYHRGKARSPLFMPRWASRLTLEVVSIRVERVQDISEEDAEAEGVDFIRHIPDADETLTAKTLYEILWDSINAKRGYHWASNPWVWVTEFKRVEQ